jgi:hypothetical protein
MNFLVYGTPYYEYLQATIVEGLTLLGHNVYGWNEKKKEQDTRNYKKPYGGQQIDYFIDAHPSIQQTNNWDYTPRILLWPYDWGDNNPFDPSRFKYDAAFIRDYRGLKNDPGNVFPINYGIEQRYFCAVNQEDKAIIERNWDVLFTGDNVGRRGKMLKMLNKSMKKNGPFNVSLGLGYSFIEEPDDYWCQWVNGRFCHCNDYFRALANSKINLSFGGSGPDCGRHYEVMASHGLPLIEKSDAIGIEPSFQSAFPELTFFHDAELRDKALYYVTNLDEAQELADRVFEFAKTTQTSKQRALYMLRCLKQLNLYSGELDETHQTDTPGE